MADKKQTCLFWYLLAQNGPTPFARLVAPDNIFISSLAERTTYCNQNVFAGSSQQNHRQYISSFSVPQSKGAISGNAAFQIITFLEVNHVLLWKQSKSIAFQTALDKFAHFTKLLTLLKTGKERIFVNEIIFAIPEFTQLHFNCTFPNLWSKGLLNGGHTICTEGQLRVRQAELWVCNAIMRHGKGHTSSLEGWGAYISS